MNETLFEAYAYVPYATVALNADPAERLAVLELDPNLMQHGCSLGGARRLLAECREACDEFVAKAPDDPATAYMLWLVAELEAVA